MFDEPCQESLAVSIKNPSLLESLQSRQLRAANELAKITEAVEALEKNPEIASIIEKISRVRGL